MARKRRTPSELKKDSEKKGYNLYLSVRAMERIAKLAEEAGVSPSVVVDEAIAAYLEEVEKPIK